MQVKSILTTLLFLFTFTAGIQATEQEKQDYIRQITLPFLDSLKIVVDEKAFAERKLIFEAVTPVTAITPETFIDYNFNGDFTLCQPLNGKSIGQLTPPIPIFEGARIALIYFFMDTLGQYYELSPRFEFRSKFQEYPDGYWYICQQLIVNIEGISNAMDILYGLVDIEIWDGTTSTRQNDNNPPIGKRTISINTEDDTFRTQYMYRSNDNIYSLIDFHLGASRTQPEFIGGNIALWEHIHENMVYPFKADKYQIGGTLLVEVLISEKGEVIEPRVIGGTNPHLNDEAIRIAYTTNGMWTPAQQNGQPVPALATFAIQFQPGLHPVAAREMSGKMGYLLLMGIGVVMMFLYYYLKDRLKNWYYRRPNNRPYSLFNRNALKENQKLINDNMLLITGVSLGDFYTYWNPRNANNWIIEEVASEVVRITFKVKPDMQEFLYMVYLFNDLSPECKGKCIGWATLPYMDARKQSFRQVMAYNYLHDNKEMILALTTKDHLYWRVDFRKFRYEEEATGSKYRLP